MAMIVFCFLDHNTDVATHTYMYTHPYQCMSANIHPTPISATKKLSHQISTLVLIMHPGPKGFSSVHFKIWQVKIDHSLTYNYQFVLG